MLQGRGGADLLMLDYAGGRKEGKERRNDKISSSGQSVLVG